MFAAMKRQACVSGVPDSRKRLKGQAEIVIGMAGTGKTTYATKALQRRGCSYTVVLTPAAALLSEMPDTFTVKLTVDAFLCRSLDMHDRSGLYIDEISMISDAKLDRVLERARRATVIMSGDPFQIPPFSTDREVGWWFESAEYQARCPTVIHLTEQKRMVGWGWAGVRRVLTMIEGQVGGWKDSLECFLMEARAKRRPDAELIVFRHEDSEREARAWAVEHEAALEGNCLAVGMRGVIKTNLIDRAKSGGQNVVYKWRNGQRGEIVSIRKQSVGIRVDGKVLRVEHGGIDKGVPGVRCAVAGVVDSAQGKTYDDHVHVIFNDYIPPPAKIVVAISRSRAGVTCEINYPKG